jgi:hypothetical protein
MPRTLHSLYLCEMASFVESTGILHFYDLRVISLRPLERVAEDVDFIFHLVGRCRLTVSKPVWKAAGTNVLTPEYDEQLSSFAFKSNLRRYNLDSDCTLVRHLMWTDVFEGGKAIVRYSKWEHLAWGLFRTCTQPM